VKPLSHTLLAVLMIAAACGGDITTGSIGGKADDFSTFEEFLASLYCEPDSDVCIVGGDVPLATEDDARDRLRLLDARFDELVARAAEVSLGTEDSDVLGNDVDGLVSELEALRAALEETNSADNGFPLAAPVDPPATGSSATS